ncbi:hypothetical protein B9Z55_016585 [Caenorhabditis nigoni]|uniref:Nucleotide-diphospho-sugar transferase domain-containing protein n=1 Tax=Caenorhabditis nigoni TaxID=1611254 RepID=A0A2G5T5B1_9PELO|nr:hypothetical protein B9Z55_016585 [Caenorhabditis nigoni]
MFVYISMHPNLRFPIFITSFATLVTVYYLTKPICEIDDLEELYTHKDCMCTSNKTGKSYNFCYPDPNKPGTYGVKFNCSFVETVEDLKLIGDADNLISLSDSIQNEDDVVFVSAASEDHLEHAMKSHASIREYYPYNKYVLFGLNISSKGMDLLPTDPNFEFRHFNATPYPEYVTNWKRYHFKGLVMAEAMRDFPIIWWIDAHSVMVDSDVVGRTFKEVSDYRLSNGYSPMFSFINAGHTNYAVMHLELLHYFPTESFDLLKSDYQVGTTLLFVPRTKYSRKIVKWWTLCSLTDECINPPGAQLQCTFDRNHFNWWAGCYRYDQSVFNILVLNDYQNYRKFYMGNMEKSFRRLY